MANTFVCYECGYTADVGKGNGWPTCPACGGNDVSVSKPKPKGTGKRAAGAAPKGKEDK